jgi:hypothetical protein
MVTKATPNLIPFYLNFGLFFSNLKKIVTAVVLLIFNKIDGRLADIMIIISHGEIFN